MKFDLEEIIKEKKEESSLDYYKLENKEETVGQSINIRAKIAMVVGEKLEIKEIFEESIQEINEGNRTAKIGGVNYENVVQIETDTKTFLNYKEPKLEIKDTRGQWVAVQTEITSHQLMSSCELETQEEALEKINILNEKLKNFSPTIEKKIIF